MATNNRKIKLRAFRIENQDLSSPDSGILGMLNHVLSATSTAQERRMRLNEEDADEDLLSNFSWAQNNTYLFGMMLRIIPAVTGGVIDDELFNHPIITMADVSSGTENQSQYKDHYYFALNNDYLVTTLSGSYSIDRLQTYINWLLGSVRGSRLFEFNPLVQAPEGIKLSEIKEIEFTGGGSATVSAGVSSAETSSNIMQNLASSVLDSLFVDTPSISNIQRDQVISAKLLLTVKRKPREMAQEEYQRVMGAVTRQITNDAGIVLKTKNGNRYTGESIKVVRDVTVERTNSNRIVEEHLKQLMEAFLTDLNNSNNV
jgi:hypothetical protein